MQSLKASARDKSRLLEMSIDESFRRAFRSALAAYETADKEQRYEPRPLQELWSARDLKYSLSDDVPPELIRRVAVNRKDWDNWRPVTETNQRWDEAREAASAAMNGDGLAEWVSKDRRNVAIDNLLGAYLPSRVEVVLYPQMILRISRELGVDREALQTVVYVHETVHAFSHVGRDHDGCHWGSFAIALADGPDATPSVAHEAIAQYYTFRLLERLKDKKLMDAFIALEAACLDVYRAWRATEHYSLEQMREVLMSCRRMDTRWPPS
jgi:hypothetical protein